MFQPVECFRRLGACPLGRRIRCFQLRIFILQLQELTVKQIPFSIADHRIIQDVITVVMVSKLFLQFFDSLLFQDWFHIINYSVEHNTQSKAWLILKELVLGAPRLLV